MSEQSQDIDIGLIDADYEWNSRKNITLESVTSLAESIRTNGQEIPVLVRPMGERFSLVCGFRRFKASTEILEATHVSAYIREMTDFEARLANFRENEERKQLTFWEECLFIKDTFPSEVQQSQIQEDLNRPYDWVRPRRQIWNLPKSIIKLAAVGVYSGRDIGELLKRDPAQQEAAGRAAEKAAARGENKKDVRKATIQRRNVRGRKNMVRMQNILEEHGLCDSKIQHILLWAVSDIDKVELASRLGVDSEIFLAIEE